MQTFAQYSVLTTPNVRNSSKSCKNKSIFQVANSCIVSVAYTCFANSSQVHGAPSFICVCSSLYYKLMVTFSNSGANRPTPTHPIFLRTFLVTGISDSFSQNFCPFRDESLSGSDITSKLEPAFLSGLRCSQPMIRAKFFEVFDASMKRRVYERLLYICCSQNWEAMGSHFWIKQCIEVSSGSRVFLQAS